MTGRTARPKPKWRRDGVRLVLALSVPLATLSLFPYEALMFRPLPHPRPSAVCAFVALSPQAEVQAIAAARSAWQVGTEGTRGARIDLFMPVLPEAPLGAQADVSQRTRTDRRTVAPYRATVLPASLAAPSPPPAAPSSAPAAPPPAFAREDLLVLEASEP